MDISAARLTSLLREAMTPQALPSAKADPVKTALVKALVQPPAPSLRPQSIAATLPALLPATAFPGKVQPMTSAQIAQAYQAMAEPTAETAGDAEASVAATRRSALDGDEAQRIPGISLAKIDDGGPVRPAVQAWLALLSPQASPLRRALATKAAVGQGLATNRPASEARPESRQMTIGLMSLAVGLLAAVIVGLVLLMLR